MPPPPKPPRQPTPGRDDASSKRQPKPSARPDDSVAASSSAPSAPAPSEMPDAAASSTPTPVPATNPTPEPPPRPVRPRRIILPADDDQLKAECEVQTYRSSGPGGQHVNTTDSAVRLRHLPSGIVVGSQSERSQQMNLKICLEKLRAEVARRQVKKKTRIPTRISRAAKERRLDSKAKKSSKKANRRRPGDTGD